MHSGLGNSKFAYRKASPSEPRANGGSWGRERDYLSKNCIRATIFGKSELLATETNQYLASGQLTKDGQ